MSSIRKQLLGQTFNKFVLGGVLHGRHLPLSTLWKYNWDN
jgi:hypothetical protein